MLAGDDRNRSLSASGGCQVENQPLGQRKWLQLPLDNRANNIEASQLQNYTYDIRGNGRKFSQCLFPQQQAQGGF